MKNNKNSILLIIPLFILVIGFVLPVHAEEAGCCGTGDAGFMRWTTKVKSSCIPPGCGSLCPTFIPNQTAKDDGSGCITTKEQPKPSKVTSPVLSVSIPGFGKFSDITCDDPTVPCQIPWIGEYIKAIYQYSIIAIGILAVVVLMLGGTMWLTAGGNKERISEATKWIRGGIMGIIIALCSYVLLVILNPNLTILKPLNITYMKKGDLIYLDSPDLSEPVPQEEINKDPKKSKVDLNPNNWKTVPNDKKGLGITTRGSLTSGEPSIEGLKKVAECFRKLDSKNYIDVASASRSKEVQQKLYNENCSGGTCNPPTCNPAGGNCPHTSGVAFDAWACNDKVCKGKDFQYQLQNCFFEAGFCLLKLKSGKGECWHFELPQWSTACYKTNHYEGKYCTAAVQH